MGLVRRGDLLTGYGYKPDRRHLFGVRPAGRGTFKLDAPIPPAFSMRDQVVEVLDQGMAPFCVAHGVAQGLRVCDRINGVVAPELASRIWIIYGAHALEHDVDSFDGAIISDAFEFIEKMGFPPERAWPYSDSDRGPFRVRPPEDVVRQAYDNIDLGYQRILSSGNQRLAEVKAAISQNCPVVFGTQVGYTFANNGLGDGHRATIPDTNDIDGGHCMLCVGYRENGDFLVVNSWGTGWGDHGFFWMAPEYMAWDSTEDVWAMYLRRAQP
jgi:hypothetical protein